MKFKVQSSKFKVVAVFVLLFLVVVAAHAQTKLEVGIPGQKAAGGSVSGPVEYIKYIYLFTLGFVGIAGFISLVMWGTVWTASGVIDKKAAALDGIKNALTGIAIAFTAFIILNTVNPDLTIIKAPTVRSIIPQLKSEKLTMTDVVDPWITAKRDWFCKENAPNSRDWEAASNSEPGCETSPFVKCNDGVPPKCFVQIPESYLRPFWNCGTTVTPPLSTRWAISTDQVPCANITKQYCSGLPLVCYATN